AQSPGHPRERHRTVARFDRAAGKDMTAGHEYRSCAAPAHEDARAIRVAADEDHRGRIANDLVIRRHAHQSAAKPCILLAHWMPRIVSLNRGSSHSERATSFIAMKAANSSGSGRNSFQPKCNTTARIWPTTKTVR